MKRITALTMILAACGGDPAPDPAGTKPAITDPSPPPPEPGPAKRTLGTARVMKTSTDNLLFDPLFTTVGQEMAFAAYAPLGRVVVPQSSPGGTAAPVLVSKGGAGDLSQLLLMGQGGTSALEARVWIATIKGDAPTVYLLSMSDPERFLFTLAPTETTQKHGDLTYRLFRAATDGGVTGTIAILFDVVMVDEIAIAAPEVREPNAQTTMSRTTTTTPAAITPAIRRAVAAAGRPLPIPKLPTPPGLAAAARRPGLP